MLPLIRLVSGGLPASFTCFLFILCISSLRLCAQTFEPRYPDPLLPGGYVEWADYDQDGDPDLVTSGIYKDDQARTVLFRNDAGDFVIDDEDFDGVSGLIQWVDWDGDADVDLVICDATIHVFLNANGVFTHQPYANYVHNMFWKDMGNDGDEDLFFIHTDTNGDHIQVWENDGSASHVRELLWRHGITHYDAADFNADGHPDLLVREGPVHAFSTNLYVSEVDGTLNHDATQSFAPVPYGALQSFDYDDDGDTDILIAGTVSDGDTRTGHLYQNNAAKFTLVDDAFFKTGYPRLVKADADNDLDVQKSNTAGDSSMYYANREAGQYEIMAEPYLTEFREILGIRYASATGEPAASYLCISGVIYTGSFALRIYHLENGTYRNLYPNPMFQLDDSRLIKWVDFNNDNLLDVYSSGASSPGYAFNQLLKSTGSDFERVTWGREAYRGDWVDYNHDGHVDLITNAGGSIRLYQGFSDPAGVSFTTLLSGIDEDAFPKLIDFDGDGDYDLFLDGYMEGIYVNENNVFTLTIIFESGFRVLGLSDWADFDLDGNPDLAMNLYINGGYDSKPRIYRNTGTTLVPVAALPDTEASRVYWIDYNVDEYPDLLVEAYDDGASRFRLFKNTAGIFTEVSVNAFADVTGFDWSETNVKIADMNVDGYPDIVAASNTASARRFVIYRNNHGVFEAYSAHGIPALRYANFDCGDFDNDGDPDVLLSGTNDAAQTQIYINDLVDLTGPLSVSLLPRTSNTLAYDNGYHLTLTFHEPPAKGNGALKFFRQGTGELLYTLNVSDAAVVVSGNTVTITMEDNMFDDGEDVYVLLDQGAFVDSHGNAGEGISDPSRWMLRIQNNKQDQFISFFVPAYVSTGQPPFKLEAHASSGLPVAYTSSVPAVATIDGEWITIVGAGTTVITATQPGNAAFNAADPVLLALVVSAVTSTEKLTDAAVLLYPNPTTGLITIRAGVFNGSAPVRCTFIDSHGKSRMVHDVAPAAEMVVDVGELPAGLYAAQLIQGDRRAVVRLVKH